MTHPQATQLRLGRVVFLGLGTLLLVGGSLYALLKTQARPTLPAVSDSGGWPAWMRQAHAYPPPQPEPPKPAPLAKDPNADLLAKMTDMQRQLLEQQLALEALKKRPSGTTVIQPQQAKAVAPPAAPRSMLFVAHDLKDIPPKPSAKEYTLAPGATKLSCIVETAMNSDVEGYMTAKVSTNIYDTATGRHLLIPQGSTILGHDQSSTLLYGNERLPTISLTLALPDGRSVDLGQAPITDQQGVAGLTGKVNQHWLRLFGAVFVGGALRGGAQLVQLETAQAGGIGTVAGGIASTGNQATQQRLGRALDTRPTIEVASGQLCQVLLTKPLHLQAMWQ